MPALEARTLGSMAVSRSRWSMAIVLTLASGVCATEKPMPPKPARTDWFRDAQWGVFTHYLTDKNMTAEEWNRRVDAFDLAGLVRQLEAIGPKYYFITLGQNSGHYCSPNATYDQFVGIQPSKCSKRDLIADLAQALAPKGIRLMVYLPSGAPAEDKVARQKLEWRWGAKGEWQLPGEPVGGRLAEFQRRWEAAIREWSLRWGRSVHGWWFDGCYFPNDMYRFPDPPNFASFAAAARAGNPDSLVAFNPGVLNPVITLTDQEDYTAGEINEPAQVKCPGRWVGQAQFHMLSYLGPTWGQGPPRFKNEQAIEITRKLIESGAVVTWDVPI